MTPRMPAFAIDHRSLSDPTRRAGQACSNHARANSFASRVRIQAFSGGESVARRESDRDSS